MNPLAAYLHRSGISQAVFAARLTKIHGAPLRQQQVWRWTRRAPRLPYRRLIARATGGAVPVDAWIPASSSA